MVGDDVLHGVRLHAHAGQSKAHRFEEHITPGFQARRQDENGGAGVGRGNGGAVPGGRLVQDAGGQVDVLREIGDERQAGAGEVGAQMFEGLQEQVAAFAVKIFADEKQAGILAAGPLGEIQQGGRGEKLTPPPTTEIRSAGMP